METADLAAITTTNITGLRTTQLAALTTAQVVALTTDQVSKLTTAQLSGLTATQLANMATDDLAAITTAQLAGLSAKQVASLTTAQVVAMTTAQVSNLSKAQLAGMTTAQVANMATDDLAAITTAQLSALTAAQMSVLTTAQVGAMSTAQRANLSATQLGALTTGQLSAIATADLANLTSAQMGNLSYTQVAALTTAQVSQLSTAQLAGLNVKQMASMETADVAAITKAAGGLHITLQDGSSLEADAVLYATGRVPLIEGLGLETLGIAQKPDGAMLVNDHYQTSLPHIYAVGDVTARVQLTPVALGEAMVVVDHLLGAAAGKAPRSMSYDFIPTAVFTHPNIGTVGFSEAEARERFGAVRVFKSEFKALKHTLSGSSERTFMKLLVDEASDRVVGLHMVGAEAGEIVQGFAVAMKAGATKAVFDSTIGIHPTAAEEFVTMREPVKA
jgi:hypothetical protein